MALKTRVKFSDTLDKILHAKLKELTAKTKIPMSRLLDEAVELLLKKHGQ